MIIAMGAVRADSAHCSYESGGYLGRADAAGTFAGYNRLRVNKPLENKRKKLKKRARQIKRNWLGRGKSPVNLYGRYTGRQNQ